MECRRDKLFKTLYFSGDIMKYLVEHKKRWLFYISLFLFVFCAMILYFGKFDFFDRKIYEGMTLFKNSYVTLFFKVITQLGNYPFIILAILFSFFVFKKEPYGKILTIGMISIVTFNFILKEIFMRERPIGNRLVEEWGYSFPSGHAMASVVFYGLLAYFLFM